LKSSNAEADYSAQIVLRASMQLATHSLFHLTFSSFVLLAARCSLCLFSTFDVTNILLLFLHASLFASWFHYIFGMTTINVRLLATAVIQSL